MFKVVKIFLTVAIMSIFSITANAQIFVNNVEVFTKMTKEQVITKFGEPTNYRYYDSQDNGVDEWFYYGKDILIFKDNNFFEFNIQEKKFSVQLEGLDCNIKVGDKFSILEPLKPVYMDWFEKNWYCVYYYDGDEKVRFKVIDGIIQCMAYSSSL